MLGVLRLRFQRVPASADRKHRTRIGGMLWATVLAISSCPVFSSDVKLFAEENSSTIRIAQLGGGQVEDPA